MRFYIRLILVILIVFSHFPAWGRITVDPVGVNIRHSGPSTVFLTFRGLAPGQQVAEGLWCGEINPDSSCVDGTIFGRLPSRSNLARPSSGGNNLTDIMTIPSSVSRRAYQDALRGNPSEFFYVRRFISASGAEEFVAVTCRMAGGGARVPLALLDVRLAFVNREEQVLSVSHNESLPRFGAEIIYNGSGRLKGRWEVVLPGDVQPSTEDLLTEGALPIEQRALQRRYTQIGRFDIFLPPTGDVYLPGPEPHRLLRGTSGLHLILLRVEATDDKESTSDVGAGIVASGGVAGFPMPVLRYFVGSESEAARMTKFSPGSLQLVSPAEGAQFSAKDPLNFSWINGKDALLYKLEVEEEEGPVFSALVDSGVSTYSAPPWIKKHTGKPLRWRINAIGPNNKVIARSGWNKFQISEEGK